MDKAVHYLDPKENELKDIDDSLRDTGDGFETKSNAFKTRFKRCRRNGLWLPVGIFLIL